MEAPILAGWLLREAGIAFPWSDRLAVFATGDVQFTDADGVPVLSGVLDNVAWAESAAAVVVPVRRDGELLVATVGRDALRLPLARHRFRAGRPDVRCGQ